MIRTRYAELAYEERDRYLWRILDTTGEHAAVIGPYYKSRVELLADLDRFARDFGATETGPALPYPLKDYWNAPSGEGPLAAQWIDKPHRLLYDLCVVLEQARILT